MNVDFLHNQIIRDTISQKFIESFNENLLPYLVSEYGDSLDEVQFYEDHIASGFRVGGEFHYPLTVVVDGRALTRWIKWQVSNYRYFDKFNPYTYKGNELLEFELLDDVPRDMKALVAGKPIYDNGGAMPILVTSAAEDKTFLAGKYSQGFVDSLAHAVTEQIEDMLGIDGLSESGVVLELRFEPGTFMEHPVGNVTYRRLLIKARGCGARDLWIKWTRLDENGIYTVSDNVATDDISFEITEDIPGKIREKEYRYLTTDDVKKYQIAMSRKNITEWRNMMRRVIRRGEVTERNAPFDEEIEITVSETPEIQPEPAPIYQPPVKHTAPPEIKEERDALDAILAGIDSDDDEPEEDINDDLAALLKTAIGITQPQNEDTADSFDEIVEDVAAEEPVEEYTDEIEDEPIAVVSSPVNEEKLRYELEQKIRAELEAELAQKNKEAEELRSRLEAQLRAELREKELLAEAARAAIIEQERLAKKREAEEAAARAEAARREEEERRAAEEKRIAEQRAAEEARIKAELAAKEKALREAEAARLAAEKAKEGEAKYVSKTAKLIFKGAVDSAITKRIHEIILATIKYYHKEDVYIKIKATVPDTSTVNLEFVKIPENELQLLVNIIKVLGRSDLGITKAILD